MIEYYLLLSPLMAKLVIFARQLSGNVSLMGKDKRG